MANNKVKYFILTGVGKTTLIKKLCALIQKSGLQPSGFYTEEVRKERIRMGFDVVSLDGERGRLARDQSLLTNPVNHNVGKYGVLVPEFESIALHCLRKPATSPSLLVIDEIGKMEFFSVPFKSMVRGIFGPESDSFVLATIPVRRGDQLIESIRNNTQGKVWTVTKENRDHIEEDIIKELKNSLGILQ
ncbi:nucleoside-triphosphatase THEP1-like [Choristoneura fumiferana]|uniref:nucleoside-triphosphatase THEP1-like n=1 Tax=Choristoneura fumiferana TaxID=7141 RepID=UPI003D15C257